LIISFQTRIMNTKHPYLTMSNIPAKKSLGQNFLVNPGIVAKIIVAADLSPKDIVLEVGPGTGILTAALAGSGARIIAIEKDHRMIEDLEAEFSAAQIEIIEGDILEFNPTEYDLKDGDYKIIANLPYYITSHFLRIIFDSWPQPSLAVVMIQKEVAQRILAKPPEMNLLALSTQYYAEPELVSYVSKGSFRPEPNVDSAVIKLIPKTTYSLSAEKEEIFFKIIKSAFAGKRKQLINTLPAVIGKNKEETSGILKEAGIDPQARPETLPLETWIGLAHNLNV
jgi:16S rRNA (adenine1518-N6/adenine1519-N6)-dimethyltransferase